jgi:hypothetical protein
MAKLEIFIGSSSESKKNAQYVQELIMEIEPEAGIRAWWSGVFFPGDTHIESLLKAVPKTNAAILIFAEDDRANKRGEDIWITRDNILVEYGIFAAAHGRDNVALARLGNPSVPSDLSGMNLVSLQKSENAEDFKEHNRAEIRRWIEQIKRNLTNKPPTLQASLPRLYQAMLAVLGWVKNSEPGLATTMDYMAADLVSAMAVSFETDNLGVNKTLTDQVTRNYLSDAVSLSAYEVTGPASWVGPTIYRYLASQIRKYLWANIHEGKWDLRIHPWLGEAINNAIKNATSQLGSRSLTIFDNPDELHWEIGTPKLQYSRVLLWTKGELKHPITESVIAIHEAFNVPLFFVEAKPENKDKDVAYLVFEKSGGFPNGLYGKKTDQYHTNPFRNGEIPGFGNALQKYRELLSRQDIMFAADARYLLLN